MHHRRPHAPPLLPHNPRQPHPVGLGRRPAGLRRPAQWASGGGRRGGRRGDRKPRAHLPGSARPSAHTRAWGGPIDVSPSHLPQVETLPGAPVISRSGSRATAWGPRARRHGRRRRWRWIEATSTRACRSWSRVRARGCHRAAGVRRRVGGARCLAAGREGGREGESVTAPGPGGLRGPAAGRGCTSGAEPPPARPAPSPRVRPAPSARAAHRAWLSRDRW